jgi:DNA-binding LacI/PurR family transcriptional regulator
VSIASVSRVLNNIPPISQDLRAQVEAAIKTLGYKSKRSTVSFQPTVVALIGFAENTYFAEIVSGIQDQAGRHGVLVNIVVNQKEPDFSSRFCRWIMRTAPSGLVLCISNAIPDEDLRRVRDMGHVPIVAINNPAKVEGIPTIRIDYERAMEKIVRHIIQFKHKRIAFLNGFENSYSSRAKRVGVETALQKLGLTLDEELHVERASTVEGGFQAMNILFDLPAGRLPTAVIASSDQMALGAMHAIRSRGLVIPGDMAVVGFDDIAMAAHANPPLTTISPPKFEIGARAMQLLLANDAGEPSVRDEYQIMESPLIVRESSGPCSELL